VFVEHGRIIVDPAFCFPDSSAALTLLSGFSCLGTSKMILKGVQHLFLPLGFAERPFKDTKFEISAIWIYFGHATLLDVTGLFSKNQEA
jgi:hypothetical protein